MSLAEIWQAVSNELTVALTAMLPIVELKGAIPVGLALGLSGTASFVCAFLGSIFPVPFLLLFLRPLINYFKNTKFFGKFFNFVERHAMKKSDLVRKYSLLGLFIFVAIPLPTTGVWTGSCIAALFDIRIKYAFPIIAAGNLVAGFIIAMTAYGLFG